MRDYCKFYVMQFKNKVYEKPKDGKLMIKFGITHHSDAMHRFDPKYEDGYVKDYSDWDIKCLYSQNFFGENARIFAEELEYHCLHELFPPETYKVWVEDYLKVENKRKYDNSGITEIRLLPFEELKNTLEYLKSQLTEEELRRKALKKKQLLEETS